MLFFNSIVALLPCVAFIIGEVVYYDGSNWLAVALPEAYVISTLKTLNNVQMLLFAMMLWFISS